MSVRQGVNIIGERWKRAAKQCRGGERMPELAKRYSSEGFMGCNDPLESALFSAMMVMEPDRNRRDDDAGPEQDRAGDDAGPEQNLNGAYTARTVPEG